MPQVNEKYTIFGKEIGLEWIESFGYQYFNSAYSLEWHEHDGFELTVSLKNEIYWELAGNSPLRLHTSELCVTQPHVTHRGGNSVICPSESLWVIFDFSDMLGNGISAEQKERLTEIFCSAGNSIAAINPNVLNAFCQLKDMTIQYYHTGDSLYATVLQNLLREIIILSSLNFLNSEQTPKISKVYNVMEYIHTHYFESISMDSLASLIYVSKANFFRIFQDVTGFTPNSYIQKVRIEKAEQSLISTDLSVTDIAIGVGFSSSQYFSNVFKKYRGISPSEYREKFGGSALNPINLPSL